MAELLPLHEHPCVVKAIYWTKGDADWQAQFREKADGKPLWSYYCANCQGWHITSMPPETYRTFNPPPEQPPPERVLALKRDPGFWTNLRAATPPAEERAALPRKKPTPPPPVEPKRSRRQLGIALTAASRLLEKWFVVVGAGKSKKRTFRRQAQKWCGCPADEGALGRAVASIKKAKQAIKEARTSVLGKAV